MQEGRYDMSPREAAAFLGVHTDTLKRWAKAERLPSFVTPGGWRRFRRADLEAFRAAQTAGEAAAS